MSILRMLLGKPCVGDPVWWAPKHVGGVITEIDGGMVIFQGGEMVSNKVGRVTPRWTTSTPGKKLRWSKRFGCWICSVDTVPVPSATHQVIRPDPVVFGASTGSFATRSN